MNHDIVAMHMAFLDEIKRQRQRLEAELGELDAVEAYHKKILDALAGGNGLQPSRADDFPQENESSPPELQGATYHDACAVALRSLGGTAKTAKVVEWLRTHGYGLNRDLRIFENGCYLAMSRKKGMFERIGPGKWKLKQQTA